MTATFIIYILYGRGSQKSAERPKNYFRVVLCLSEDREAWKVFVFATGKTEV